MLVRAQLFTKIFIKKLNEDFNNINTNNYVLTELSTKNLTYFAFTNFIKELKENDESLQNCINELFKKYMILEKDCETIFDTDYLNYTQINIYNEYIIYTVLQNKNYFTYFIKYLLFDLKTFIVDTLISNDVRTINLVFFNYLNYYNFYNKKLLIELYKININEFYTFCLNIKKKKPFITLNNNNKIILTVSTGFILKKLMISDKKAKKHLKTLYLILKIIINDINKKLNKNKKFLILINGTKKKILTILNFLKKKLKFKQITLIYKHNFYQNSIKFKKIKSIKKRLKKKNLNK